jgi:hypothetical protein
MTGPDPLRHAELSAMDLAAADPLRAVRVLVRGLRLQSRGGQLCALRVFVRSLIEADPGLSQAIAADLNNLTGSP